MKSKSGLEKLPTWYRISTSVPAVVGSVILALGCAIASFEVTSLAARIVLGGVSFIAIGAGFMGGMLRAMESRADTDLRERGG